MVEQREPVATVGFIDDYCQAYRPWFADVRNFEVFKFLHVGMLREIPRKSLPAISKVVGLKDGQALHHFLGDGVWNLKQVRATRLWMIQQTIGERKIALCLDETGDAKKGRPLKGVPPATLPSNTLATWGTQRMELCLSMPMQL